ncbi:hypothetical protein MRB53_020620 [Persea americana]|uniref:Uncharacterized protein n=1 Tax=Persea americana TaxID=3435 RepID=A0ACC2L2T0_PERAE|nr:hypothetical protein MRB53_020620 [Persea americana]
MSRSIAPFIDNAGTVFTALSFSISVQAHMLQNGFVEDGEVYLALALQDKRLVVPKKKKPLDKRLKELTLDEDGLYWIFNKFSISKWIAGRNQLPWLMMLSDPNSKPPRSFRVFDNTIYDAIKLRKMHYKHYCRSFNNADAHGWLMTTDIDSDKNLKLFHPWRRIE